MEIICELNDETVLGTGGRSGAMPRYTARAIVKDRKGRYAVMYARKFSLYSLPGGGIEEGESPTEALKREVFEETGCVCDRITELGIINENRASLDFTQCSYYYIAEVSEQAVAPALTEGEIKSGTSVEWHSFEEAVELISAPKHTTVQRKYLQARDLAALNEYKKRFKEGA